VLCFRVPRVWRPLAARLDNADCRSQSMFSVHAGVSRISTAAQLKRQQNLSRVHENLGNDVKKMEFSTVRRWVNAILALSSDSYLIRFPLACRVIKWSFSDAKLYRSDGSFHSAGLPSQNEGSRDCRSKSHDANGIYRWTSLEHIVDYKLTFPGHTVCTNNSTNGIPNNEVESFR
jgi:hypothetical protein